MSNSSDHHGFLEDGNYIDHSGDLVWVKDGHWHRLDGPALIRICGQIQWRRQGQIHRTDGPAITYSNGEVGWHIADTQYTFEEWLEVNAEISAEEKVMLKLQYG
jgi:hypothetical protein